MTPEGILQQLQAEAFFSATDSKAFRDLSASGAFKLAMNPMSRMMLSCGDIALQDGRHEYWAGVKAGLNMFFEMTESESMRAQSLIDDVIHREKNEMPEDDEEDGVDLTQAISALGGGSL